MCSCWCSLSSSSAGGGSGGGEQQQAAVLANASDVTRFGFFQRPAAREFIVFVTRTVALRTRAGTRQTVQHQEYKVHCYNQGGLCAVAFTDDHYPVRSAFSLLGKVLEDYLKTFGESWRTAKDDATQHWQYLDDALTKYQFCFPGYVRLPEELEPVRKLPEHPFNNLKSLQVTGFKACIGQVEFLSHMVENAPALEVLSIDNSNKYPLEGREKNAKTVVDLIHRIVRRYLEGKIPPNCTLILL